MVATVNNPPAAAAGKKTADLPQQAPSTGASALRLNNAAGNDFAKMSRSIVVDYGEKVSPREVKDLIQRYETLKPSTKPKNGLEQQSRDSIDEHMRVALDELLRFSETGQLSRKDFEQISKAVVEAKLNPSADTHNKAFFAMEDPRVRAGLAQGGTAGARDQLLQMVMRRGNFADDRGQPDLRHWRYDAQTGAHHRRDGATIERQSNTEKAYHILTTLDPSAVDGTEMGEFRSVLNDMLTRGNGFFSDADIQRLTVMRDVANESRGHNEWRTQPFPMPPPPVNTIQPFPMPTPPVNTMPVYGNPPVSALPVFGNPGNPPVSTMPVYGNPPVSALPVFGNPGNPPVSTMPVYGNPPVSALPVFGNPANPPVSALPTFGNHPMAQAMQAVFDALMKQLGVNAPFPSAAPAVMPVGRDLQTGDRVGPNVDWRQMYGEQPGSNFLVVPTQMADEARNRLALGYSNADVSRDIWTRFRQEWGDRATSVPVTRFGDAPNDVGIPGRPLPPVWQPPLPPVGQPRPEPPLPPVGPQPPLPPVQQPWGAIDHRDGTGSIDIGTHTIRLNEKSSEWVVTDKQTGKQTRIWGDPHVDYNNDGKTDLDFKGNLNLMLGNTRIHIETVPWGKTGQTLSSRLTISDGRQALVVNGLAQKQSNGVDTDGKMQITRLDGNAAARAYDSNWGDQVVHQGQDGAWYVASGQLKQGALKLGADGKERIDFSKVDGSKRLPQFGGPVGGGFTIADRDQMTAALRMMMQQMMDLMQRMQGGVPRLGG
jgi:hypothetical protein